MFVVDLIGNMEVLAMNDCYWSDGIVFVVVVGNMEVVVVVDCV